jgi:hypothetical protein
MGEHRGDEEQHPGEAGGSFDPITVVAERIVAFHDTPVALPTGRGASMH